MKLTTHSAWAEYLGKDPEYFWNSINQFIGQNTGLVVPKEIDNFALAPIVSTTSDDLQVKDVSERIVKLVYKALNQVEEREPGRLFLSSGLHKDALGFFSKAPLNVLEVSGMARPDLIVSNKQLRVMEVNVGSALGGTIECNELGHFFANHKYGVEAAKSQPYYCDSPLTAIVEYLKQLGEIRGLKRPQVGILEWDFNLELNHRYAAYLTAHGLPAAFMNLDFLSSRDGLLLFDGRPVDIGIPHFHLSDLDLPEDTECFQPIFEAIEANKTLILGGGYPTLMSDKRLLGWLYENSDQFEPLEREFIRNHIPWSAEIAPGKTLEFEGVHLSVEALCQAQFKSRFVIKGGTSLQGQKVIIGSEANESLWYETVKRALENRDSLLQEYLHPDSIELPFFEDHKITWKACPYVLGKYVFGERAIAGNLVRYTKTLDSGVINYHTGSHVTCSFVTKDSQ